MLLVSFIPYINIGVAFCVKWMIYVMNFIVSWIENLPFSIVKGLYVNGLEFVCLIIAILLLMMTIEYKKKYMIYGLLSVLLVFSVSQLHRSIVQRNRMSLAIYSLNKNTAVDFVCGNGHVLLCDTITVRDPSVLSFSIENNLIKEGVYNNGVVLPVCEKNFENFFMKKRENIVSFCGKTIGFLDEKSTFSVKLPYRPHVDYFVVHGRNKVDLEKLLNCYIIDLLVIDGSVPNYLSERILRKAVEMGQECHDVKRDGALVLKL